MFTLHLHNKDKAVEYLWDADRSILIDNLGDPVDLAHLGFPFENRQFQIAKKVHPTAPLGKSRKVKTLKIQMGFSCNYSCAYCNQALHAHFKGADLKSTQEFMDNLDNWLEGEPQRIEFWGGEPLVYWSKIKLLAPQLRKKFPNAHFNMIINGSMLTDEVVDFLIEHKFGVNISHDGPAQAQRHPEDILDDPKICALIRRLHATGNMGFGAVLTKGNYRLSEIRGHIESKAGLEPGSASINTEEIMLPYDDDAMAVCPVTHDEHSEALHTLFHDAVANYHGSNSVKSKIQDFLSAISTQRPYSSLGQKCGMDREDTIAVDIKGNVTTCQNTAADTHKIGNVSAFDDISLTTAYHMDTRENCKHCPVVQLCKGSCLFLEGDKWEASCDVSFTYNLAMMAIALFEITDGMMLYKITGPRVRREGVESKFVISIGEILSQCK